MASSNIAYLAFNRGLVSRLALARADLKRMGLSAQIMVNWMPRAMGSMMLRPGTKYLGGVKSNAPERLVRFEFSTSQKAVIELTALCMRAWINDVPVTRAAVSTTVTGGDFPTAASLAANWTNDDSAGATSAWVAAGQIGFTGNGTAHAKRTQFITVAAADLGVEHAIDVSITRGPITVMVGTTAGNDDLVSETDLDTGHHSLAFTPTGSFYVRFESRLERITYLASCQIAPAGAMEVIAPWTQTDLQNIKSDQSGDIIFVASMMEQYKIERRSTTSWSCSVYQSNDGPFRSANISPTTLTPSVLTGNGTLIASVPTFKSTNVGSLYAVTSTGQRVSKSMTASGDVTNSIQVTGTGTDRAQTIDLSGLSTTGNTVVLQRSFDNATWTDVDTYSWTADTVAGYTDGLDNQIVYYRLKCTVYAAGTTVAILSIATGSTRGICRVTAFTSNVNVDMEVLTAFGGTAASDNWEESIWSDRRGWPSSVQFYEGRLGWFGKDRATLSVSDGFFSFDQTVVGDSGPIVRTIGSGPVDTINWALALQRLVLGGQGAEHSCRSSSLDEPLTPTNFNIKAPTNQGSANVQAVKVDKTGIFVQRSGTRIFQTELSAATYEYESQQLSEIVPEIGLPSIVRMDVQRQPDTRIHFIRSDGTVAVLLFNKVENIICWLEVETDGAVEDVCILPGDDGDTEDLVYYVVKRTINGSTVRFMEKWAFESDCVGTSLNLQGDAFVTYSGVPTNIITGLDHLEGESVVVWADGVDVGTITDGRTKSQTYTVASGAIVLAAEASNVMVGLPYVAQWKSAKLVSIPDPAGTPLNMQKTIKQIGVILDKTHAFGLRFGPDFNTLDDLPSVAEGAPVDPNSIYDTYDDQTFPFPGKWNTDSRLCLEARAPRPCTVLSAVLETEIHP